MLLVDEGVTDGVTVFSREGLVYVSLDESVTTGKLAQQLSTIFHYAIEATESIEDLLDLEKVGEIYKGESIAKFRV
jgi:hypothetical protein